MFSFMTLLCKIKIKFIVFGITKEEKGTWEKAVFFLNECKVNVCLTK